MNTLNKLILATLLVTMVFAGQPLKQRLGQLNHKHQFAEVATQDKPDELPDQAQGKPPSDPLGPSSDPLGPPSDPLGPPSDPPGKPEETGRPVVTGGPQDPRCDPVELPPLTLPECPCVFSELPGLGNGVAQGFEQRAEASQVATLTAIPDTQFTQICQSNCCECAESAHASISAATKNRTFVILGSISVIETLEISETSEAAENSKSREQKDTICITNNQNGGLGVTPDCINVSVCPPSPGVGLGYSVE